MSCFDSRERSAVFFADLLLDDSAREAWIGQLEIALTAVGRPVAKR
jgi:hypothetical protein